MSHRILVIALTLSFGLFVLGGAPPSAQAQPVSLDGSWLVRLPDFGDERQLISFLPGGVLLATNTPTEVEDDGERQYTTPGHGAWTSLGGGRYAFTFVALIADDSGAQTGMFALDATVALSTDGGQFSGSFTIRGMTPAGRELFTSPPLAIEATRIQPPVAR